jgi:hypothetical protein
MVAYVVPAVVLRRTAISVGALPMDRLGVSCRAAGAHECNQVGRGFVRLGDYCISLMHAGGSSWMSGDARPRG